jgi:hypothetical protein
MFEYCSNVRVMISRLPVPTTYAKPIERLSSTELGISGRNFWDHQATRSLQGESGRHRLQIGGPVAETPGPLFLFVVIEAKGRGDSL